MSDTPKTDAMPHAERITALRVAHKVVEANVRGFAFPTEYQLAKALIATEAELAAATARLAELTDKDLCKMGQSPCEYALTLIARAESAEKLLAEATALASINHYAHERLRECTERDALQRAAEVCEAKAEEERNAFRKAEEEGCLMPWHQHYEACRDAILALIPKERT